MQLGNSLSAGIILTSHESGTNAWDKLFIISLIKPTKGSDVWGSIV